MSVDSRAIRTRLILALGVVLLTCAVSVPAHAFRLPVNFNQSAAIGGSGGRYFTGSPSDRYTCKVCHSGGQTPQLQVSGLPLAGYTPGQTYPILIDWDDSLAAVAFNLEMTDATGKPFGTFSLPPTTELAPAELCSGVPALAVVPGPERTLALLTECGAHQSTLRWTAPVLSADVAGAAVPQAWFSGSLIVSNKDGSVDGDAVMDLSHVFGEWGQAAPAATTITAGCSVAVPRPRSEHGFWAVWCLLAANYWLRRGRKAVS